MKNILKSRLTIIIFTIFLDALGFGILIPIVPLLFANPDSSFYLLSGSASVQSGYVLLGLITAIFPLMQFFSTSILGEFSDKFGRKPILIYTLFGTGISYLLFAFAIFTKNIPLLFFSRAIAGITAGNMSVAQAAIADLTKPEDRAKNFGLIGAAFGTGFIIGPFLGGKLSDPNLLSFLNPTIPFYFAAILAFINAFSVKFNFIETNKFLTSNTKIIWGKAIANIFKAFQIPSLRFLFLTNFVFFSGFTFFVTFISVFFIKKFNFNQGDIGNFFSFMGLWIVFTQAIVTRRLAKIFSEKQILRFTIIGDGLCIGLMFFITNSWMLFALAPFIAICQGLTFANLTGLISRSADGKIQGEILGINASVQAIAQLIPPILSGFIAAYFTPETPLMVASIVIILAGLLFITLYKSPKSPAHIQGY